MQTMTALARVVSCIFLAISLGSCASVPDARGQATQKAVRISTEQGWLGYRASQQLIDKLGATAQDDDFLAAHLKVEEAVAGSPLTTGNDVRMYDDGPNTYQAMFEAIRSANSYIHLETYIFDDDELGRKLGAMLAAKRAQGVEVAVMVDGVGTLSTPADFFDGLRRAGIQVVVFNPVNPLQAKTVSWSLNQRNHRKILIVDGVVGFTGGINLSDVYTSSPSAPGSSSGKKDSDTMPPWRDTHVRIAGPAVLELEKVFLKGWREQNGPPLAAAGLASKPRSAGKEVVRIIANDPNDKDGYGLYLTLMSAISSARQSIFITMAYFVPDPAFIQALKDAAARGVKVVLILPEFSDSALVLHAGRSHYTGLLQGGVAIFERTHALLHAKTAVIDGVWSTVGSSNLDWRSFTLNYEVNAVVLGTYFGQEMTRLFEDDLRQSHPVTLQAWQDRGIDDRFMEFLGRMAERWL